MLLDASKLRFKNGSRFGQLLIRPTVGIPIRFVWVPVFGKDFLNI